MSVEQLIEAQKAVDEIKSYDLSRIARRDELGQVFNFEDALTPARKVQEFFSRIPAEFVPELSSNFIATIQNQALTFLNVLGQIHAFNPQSEDNPSAARLNILNSLSGLYETVFNNLHPAVSFVAARQRDFSSMELEARAAKEGATRQAAQLAEAMKENQREADSILVAIRNVAAEQGVSQQAAYFKDEANKHHQSAVSWEGYTIKTAIGLGAYAVLTLLFALFYTPESNSQVIQLGLSKLLIFSVIAYMLFHCARTTLSHRHNAVVNRHRENALLTFNSLVAAAGAEDKRDIVLTHAAACIFSPQDTGYVRPSGSPQFSSSQLIDALPRLSSPMAGS